MSPPLPNPLQEQSDPYCGSSDAPLHLFSCRSYYIRHGNLRAYTELVSASRSTDPKVRTIAESLLADCVAQDHALSETARRPALVCPVCT